jgi:hypothetical protein
MAGFRLLQFCRVELNARADLKAATITLSPRTDRTQPLAHEFGIEGCCCHGGRERSADTLTTASFVG